MATSLAHSLFYVTVDCHFFDWTEKIQTGFKRSLITYFKEKMISLKSQLTLEFFLIRQHRLLFSNFTSFSFTWEVLVTVLQWNEELETSLNNRIFADMATSLTWSFYISSLNKSCLVIKEKNFKLKYSTIINFHLKWQFSSEMATSFALSLVSIISPGAV